MTDYSCLKDIHVSEGTDTTKSDLTCLHGRKNTDKFSHHQKNRASNKESNGDHDSHVDHTFFTHIYDCMEGRKMPPKKADCSDHIRLAVDLTPVIYNIRRAKNEAYVIQNRLKWMQKSKSTPDLSKIGDEILFLEGFADSSTLDTRKCSHTYSRSRAHQRRRGDCPYCARVRSNSAPNVGEKEETFTGQSENLPRQKSGSQSNLRSPTRWRSEEEVEDRSKKVKATYYKSRMKIDIGGDSTAMRASNPQENERKTVVGDGDKERKTVREELSVRLESGEQRKTKSTSDLRYSCMVDPNDKDTVFSEVEKEHPRSQEVSPKTEEKQTLRLTQKQSLAAGKLEENDKVRERQTVTRREQSNEERSDISEVPTKTEEMQYKDQEVSTTSAKSREHSKDKNSLTQRKSIVTRRAQANKEQSDVHKIPKKKEQMQLKELSATTPKSREHDKDKNRKSTGTRRAQARQEESDIHKAPTKTDQERSTTTAKSRENDKNTTNRKSTVTGKAQENQEKSDIHKISTKTEEKQYKDQELSRNTAKSRENDKDIGRKSTVTRRAQENEEQCDTPKILKKTEQMQYKDQKLSTTTLKSREQNKDDYSKSNVTRRAQANQEKSGTHKISTKTVETQYKDQKLSTTTAESGENDKGRKATVKDRTQINQDEVVQQPQELPDSSPRSSKPLSSASLLLAKAEPTTKKDQFVAKKVEMPPPKKLDLKGYYSIENLFQNRSKWLSRSQDDLLEDRPQKKLSKDFTKKSSQQVSRSQEDLLDESSQKKLSKDDGKEISQELSRSQEDLVDKGSQIKKFSRSEEDLLDIGTRKTFRKERTKKASLASPTRMRLSRSEENLISEDNSKKKTEIGPLTIDPSKFSATSVEVFREIPNVQANLVKERISLYESFVEENPSVEIRSKSLPRNMSKTEGDLRSRSLPRNVYEKFEGKTSQETVVKKSTAAARRSRGFSRRADFKKAKVPSSDQKKESRKEVYKPKVTEETPKKDVKNSSTFNDFKPSQVKQQLRNRRHGTTEQTSLESKPKVGKEEAKETKKDVQTFSASKEVQPSKMKQHTRSKSPGKTEETSSELKNNLKAVTESLTNEIADDTVLLRKVRRSDKIPESSEGFKAVDEKQPQVKEKVEKLKYPRVEGDAFILTKIRTTQLMEDEDVDSKTIPAKNFTKGTNGLTTAVAGYALNRTEEKLVNAKPVWIDTGWPKKGELDGFYTAKYGWIEPQKPKTVQEGIFLAKMVWAASDSDHDSTYTAPGRIGPRPRPTSPTSDAGCQTDPEFAFSDTEVQTDGLDKFAYNRRNPSSVETFKTQIETIVTAMAQPIVSAALAAERQQQSQMPQNGSSSPGVASSLGMALRVAEDVVDTAIEKAGKIARPIPTRTTTMGIQTERDGPFLAPVQEEHEEEAETDGSGFRPLSDRLRRKREESVRTVELDNEPALLYEGKKRKGHVDPKKGSMLARADLDSTLASIIGEEAPEQKAEFTTEMKFTAVYKTNESAASGKDSPTGSIDRDDLLEEDQNWMIPEPKPKRLLSRKISGSMEALNSATPLDKTPYDDHDSVVSEPDEKEASDEDITAVEKESRTPTNGSLSPGEIRKSDFGEDEVQKYEQRIAKEQKLRKKRELGETKSTHVSNELCDHDKTTALQKKVQAKSKQQNANNEEPDDFNLNKLVHIHGRLDSLDTQLKGVPPNSSRTGKTRKSPKERKPSEEGYYSAKGESISSPRSEIPEDFTDHLSKSAFDTYSKRVSQIPLSSTASSLSSASPDMDSTTPIFSDSGANSPGGSYSMKRKEEIEISNLSEKVSAKQEEVLESAQDILHSANQQTAARAARQVTSTVLTTLKSAEQVSQGQPDEVKTISVKRKQGSMDEAERLEEEVYLNAGKVFALQEDLRHLQSQVENIQEDTPEPQVRALEERVTRTIAQVQQSAEHVRKSQERLEEIGVGPVKIIEDRMKNVNLGSSPTSTSAPTRPVPAPRKSLQQKVAEEHNRRKSPGNSRQHSRRNSRTNLAMSPEREEEVFDRNQAYRNSITKRGGESGLKWELAQEPPQEPEAERPKRLADVRRWRAKNQKAETDSSEPLNRLKSDGMTSPSVRERAAVWDQHWQQETDKQRLKNDSVRVLSQWEVEKEKKRQEWSPVRHTSPTSSGWSRESSISPGRRPDWSRESSTSPGRRRDWSRESPTSPGNRFDWSRGNPTSPGSRRDWSKENPTSPGNRPGPTADDSRPVYYSRKVMGRRGMVTSL